MSNEWHEPVSPAPADGQLRCAKCGHDNPRTADVCSQCGKHLYLVCKECGHRNVRLARKCARCGRRLHRSLLVALKRKTIKDRSVIGIAILIVLVVIIVWLVQMIMDFTGKPHEPASPEGPKLEY